MVEHRSGKHKQLFSSQLISSRTKSNGTKRVIRQTELAHSNPANKTSTNPYGKPKLSQIAAAVRVSIVGLGLAHGAVEAATIQVSSNQDNSPADACTLREAIVSINDGTMPLQTGCNISSGVLGTDDSITFSNSLPSNTIELDNAQLEMASGADVSIDASAIYGGITIDANAGSRVFAMSSATLTINNLIITNGQATGSDEERYGGGILAAYGSKLTVIDSTISNNSASSRGGGIYIRENTTLTLSGSTVSNNSGAEYGGGIYVGADGGATTLSLTNSTVANNSSTASGGGIYARENVLVQLNGSTVSGNSAVNYGGGIFISDDVATLIITNGTVSGNIASSEDGGGIYSNGSPIYLYNSTVADNLAGLDGGGIHSFVNSPSITIVNSIIADNTAGRNDKDCRLSSSVSANTTTDAASIIEDGNCEAADGRDQDPGLLPLANNGGPTQTHAIPADSLARNSGIIGTCETNDQRERTRDDGDGLCDVGAFEIAVLDIPTILVTSDQDDNGVDCTLREALVSANSNSLQNGCIADGGVTGLGVGYSVTFSNSLASNTIILNSAYGELRLTQGSTAYIDASSISGGITIDANEDSRVFNANSATLSLDNMRATGGYAEGKGGGIYAAYSQLTISNSTISGNSTFFQSYDGYGGGIFTTNSDLQINNSIVTGNSAYWGGGIYQSTGEAIIANSTISENSANYGGGVYAFDPGIATSSVEFIDSTVSGNMSGRTGGGLIIGTGFKADLTNSTISGNSASYTGGGIYSRNLAVVSLFNSTVNANSAAVNEGGIRAASTSTISLTNSIVANSVDGDPSNGQDCAYEGATVSSDSFSIIGDGSCDAVVLGAIAGNPGLDSLSNNGGATRTHALRANSIARNAADPNTCSTNDQRDQLRIEGGDDLFCDIGAVEFNPGDGGSFIVIPLGADGAVVIPN